jgi:hypothetical protein
VNKHTWWMLVKKELFFLLLIWLYFSLLVFLPVLEQFNCFASWEVQNFDSAKWTWTYTIQIISSCPYTANGRHLNVTWIHTWLSKHDLDLSVRFGCLVAFCGLLLLTVVFLISGKVGMSN